ncbi:metal ABC transporter substrate-binding protein [Streptomyces sp. NPDC057638]|uniref:metal ABC transporter substrate-binding protein n=1 Tax=Streptomyces sp. NPDC057638 TaxID=3346190 RepID=UPI00369A2033
MNVRRPIRTTVLAAGLALGLAATAACSSSDASEGTTDDGRLRVTASFYPLQFLAERVGGDRVEVTTLTKPGVEPHDLELTPRQTARLGEAGYVLYLKGLQPAVDKVIAQADVPHKIDAATLTTAADHTPAATGATGTTDSGGHKAHGESDHDHGGTDGHDHSSGDSHAPGDGHDHGTEPAQPTGPAKDDGKSTEKSPEKGPDGDHGHSHEHESGTDPHIWLDPVQYAEAARGVGETLAKADPDHAATYRANATALVTELNALHARYQEGLKNTTTKTFITTHTAFGHLAERYGLDQEGITGIAPGSEPSPARIKELHSIAAKDKVTTVFFETLASDRTAKTLAQDAGLKTDVLDPLEGITEKSRGADYLQVMDANLTALQKALGSR